MPDAGAWIALFILALLCAVVSWGYTAYQRDLRASRERLRGNGRRVGTRSGPIEYAEAGDGAPVLISHGAGGGFDQGLELGQPLARRGLRVIAMSRFGYLGTPLPANASAIAQADAHAQLLDVLGIKRVAILGASAGAPSAMQFAIRYPQRCSALVLLVPLAYKPADASAPRMSPWPEKILMTIVGSDLVYWLASKFARGAVIERVLGTPPSVLAGATEDERNRVNRIMETIPPISRRIRGIINDAHVYNTLTRFDLEKIVVPTLVLSARDDGYATYAGAEYTAQHVSGARFVGFESGGHLLVGHQDQVIEEAARLLEAVTTKTWKAANAQ
jgi:2-hydroxy-6-oxonona-2,4-dienedioate hydrolase